VRLRSQFVSFGEGRRGYAESFMIVWRGCGTLGGAVCIVWGRDVYYCMCSSRSSSHAKKLGVK
jgi:hypothetical protein